MHSPDSARSGRPFIAALRDWALPILAILVLTAALGWDTWQSYRRNLEQEYRLLDAHARIADAQLSGALRVLDTTLQEVAAERLATPAIDPKALSRLLAERSRSIPEMRLLFLTDAAGRIEAISDPAFLGVDASRREYFTRPRDVADVTGYFISRPYTSERKAVVMAISRALRDSKGNFLGVVAASIEPDYFSAVLETVKPDGAGFAFITNTQGDILHAVSSKRELIGRNLRGGPAFEEHVASGARTTRHLSRTKFVADRRISVLRRLDHPELIVFLTRDYGEAIAVWRRNALNRAAIFVVAAAALLYLGWLGRRRQRQLLSIQAGLRESEAQLRRAQEITHVGSWALDLQANRLTWSDEAYRIFAVAPGTPLTYELFLDHIHPEDREAVNQAWGAALAGAPYDFEHRIVVNGETRWVRERAEFDYDINGRPLAAIGTTHDITERKEAELKIQTLNETLEQRVRERTAELENSNRELESFSYSVSHDLRAPLRAIDGFSHVIAEDFGEAIGETGRNHLDRIRRATQKMGTLIDNLLNLAQVSRQGLRHEAVGLSRIVADLAQELGEASPGRSVAWVIQPDLVAQGDPVLLKVALSNLLRNAWKFTAHAAAPRIEFGRSSADGIATYFVRDNGVGIDMAYANKLFQPFQRLHDPREFEGTGIGLAIVHRVILRHGGSIRVESMPGQGATFFFTLP